MLLEVVAVHGIPLSPRSLDRADTGIQPIPPFEFASCTAPTEVVCEMVLSLRTLATVSIYFLDEQSRRQLCNFGTLRAKMWARLTGKIKSKARFQRSRKLEEVRMIRPNNACELIISKAFHCR